MFDITRNDGVLRVRRPDARWLSTGWRGGESRGDAAYNVSVPTGWECDDIPTYLDERLPRAGFDRDGPVLMTGVELRHARGARLGPVEAVATAGVSNPAALPVGPGDSAVHAADDRTQPTDDRPVGTVNLVVGTTRALAPGALANLVAVAAEAKAATLLAETGFPGTTTDAIIAACDPGGDPATYSGSATPVGSAARACVRDALVASLRSRYGGTDAEIPTSVADAKHGVVTDERADLFRPARNSP